MRIPRRIILTVLCGNPRRGTIWTTKHHRCAHLTTRHIQRFSRRIDDLVHCLHGEVECHKFNDRTQPAKGRTHGNTGKAMFRNWCVYDAFAAKLIQHPLRDFIGTLIFADFFAHQKYGFIAPHLFGHCIAQRLAHCLLTQLCAIRPVKLNSG